MALLARPYIGRQNVSIGLYPETAAFTHDVSL